MAGLDCLGGRDKALAIQLYNALKTGRPDLTGKPIVDFPQVFLDDISDLPENGIHVDIEKIILKQQIDILE